MEHKITFVVFTYNEEHRIGYVLRCFKDYGKILIVDNMSTDKTVEIAKKYGADVYCRLNNSGFGESEEEVSGILRRVSTDWVYWGYADELCPRSLLEKLVEVADEGRYKIVRVRRSNLNYGILGLTLEYPYQTKLFQKGAIDFAGNVIHCFGRPVCPPEQILDLPGKKGFYVYHFSTYDLKKFEINHSGYSTVEAQQKIKTGKRFSFVRLLVFPFVIFFKFYVLNGSWRYGTAGFILSMEYAFFRFNVAAKMWEMERGLTLENIEKKYDVLKEKLLKGDAEF